MCLPYERFNNPKKLDNTQRPPYETFFSKLRNKIPLEQDCSDFRSIIDGGLTSEQALSKLKLKQAPATGQKNYHYVTSMWQENMRTFENFLLWYSDNDVVPTLENLRKMVDFNHNTGIEMLKLGCVLPNLANICLHKSTTVKIYPFTESDKDLLEN